MTVLNDFIDRDGVNRQIG